MLSIRTKRKQAKSIIKETPAVHSSTDTTKDELLDGSLELIDLLYDYIMKDGVGITYVQKMIQNGLEYGNLLKECDLYIEKVNAITASLTESTKTLTTFLTKEKETATWMTSTMDSLLHHEETMSHSLSRIQGIIKSSEERNDTGALGSDLELKKLKDEVAALEMTLSSSSNMLQCVFMNYDEKVSHTTSAINELLIRLTDAIRLLNDRNLLMSHIDCCFKLNKEELALLSQREHDNTIMLNDLLSFIIQLKSILTCLKEDSYHN